MKIPAAKMLAAIALAIFIAVLLAPSPADAPEHKDEAFVNSTAEGLLLQTHELPKYRPPINWNRVLKGPIANDVAGGMTDGAMAAYSRKYVSDETSNVEIVEQVSHHVYVFDSFENATVFSESRLETLSASPPDVTFPRISSIGACTGFYNRTASVDTMITNCRYGNVVYEVKSFSKLFESKNRTLAVIAATDAKLR